jgi:CheY-like chemotaxis protein
MNGDKERVRAAVCDGHIAKPIDTRTLLDVVSGLLERKSVMR